MGTTLWKPTIVTPVKGEHPQSQTIPSGVKAVAGHGTDIKALETFILGGGSGEKAINMERSLVTTRVNTEKNLMASLPKAKSSNAMEGPA